MKLSENRRSDGFDFNNFNYKFVERFCDGFDFNNLIISSLKDFEDGLH